jgi:hypothetical protein
MQLRIGENRLQTELQPPTLSIPFSPTSATRAKKAGTLDFAIMGLQRSALQGHMLRLSRESGVGGDLGGWHLGQLDVVLPQASGMVSREVGAEQIAPFPAPNHADFVPVQGKGEGLLGDGLLFGRQIKIDQAVRPPGLFLGGAELNQAHHALVFVAGARPSVSTVGINRRRRIARSFCIRRRFSTGYKLSRLLDQFDLHRVTDLLPRLHEEFFFQLAETPPGRAHQISGVSAVRIWLQVRWAFSYCCSVLCHPRWSCRRCPGMTS